MTFSLRARCGRMLFTLFTTLLFMMPVHQAHTQSQEIVSLELALLVDVSASVSLEEYRLQLDGLSAAFASPAVLRAVRQADGIAVAVIPWAQQAYQYVGVEWAFLKTEQDARAFAKKVLTMPRRVPSGQTAIGNALAFALHELETNPFVGERRVIDLSGDGRANDGILLKGPREEILYKGITINALAILNEMPDLAQYFQQKLIGGSGAFVMTAYDYTDFARAIREKLAREMATTPIASAPASETSVKNTTAFLQLK